MPDAADVTAAEVRRDPQARTQAIRQLWQLDTAPGGHRQAYLYAILDAARDQRIYPGLRRLAAREQVIGLYQGNAARELAAVAPYLVCLGVSDRVFDWLWQEGWGESWGIFLWSLVTPETLRTHFRRCTMVRTEDGQQLLFRFYDPRVLMRFLPTCDALQLREMFGPVARYVAEAENGAVLIAAQHRSELVLQTFRLRQADE